MDLKPFLMLFMVSTILSGCWVDNDFKARKKQYFKDYKEIVEESVEIRTLQDEMEQHQKRVEILQKFKLLSNKYITEDNPEDFNFQVYLDTFIYQYILHEINEIYTKHQNFNSKFKIESSKSFFHLQENERLVNELVAFLNKRVGNLSDLRQQLRSRLFTDELDKQQRVKLWNHIVRATQSVWYVNKYDLLDMLYKAKLTQAAIITLKKYPDSFDFEGSDIIWKNAEAANHHFKLRQQLIDEWEKKRIYYGRFS
ncbi:hypothetical protein [Paraferrimonas sp. SM1919]|uniref:hypothetical protein n=1 Tax=Paraferrimonas sp. SM1919 TaxID=2662263 RepID=UPI0013D73840|nr:hypothetical protein [Paraferrimonas sp. SM1919]